MTKVLVLGSSGMAGHVITMTLEANPSLETYNISRTRFNASTTILDVSDLPGLERAIADLRPDIIINCVGALIEAAEADPEKAIMINSLLPHHLVHCCDMFGGRLVHLSTDCVFSGKDGPYHVDDLRDGDSIYDRTKALGEVRNERDLSIRTSITGPELKKDGTGLFHWFMGQHGSVKGYANAMWSGVMTTELARYIERICVERPDRKGLVHLSTEGGTSKYDLLMMFKDEFERDIEIIRFENSPVDKRLIPSQGLGHAVPDYRGQVKEMHRWMDGHAQLYAHYHLSKGTEGKE